MTKGYWFYLQHVLPLIGPDSLELVHYETLHDDLRRVFERLGVSHRDLVIPTSHSTYDRRNDTFISSKGLALLRSRLEKEFEVVARLHAVYRNRA